MGGLNPVFSRRLLRFSFIFLCFSAAIVVRLSNYKFVFANFTGHLNFIDTDCYYYLRRLVHFISNFPSLMLFDVSADWPRGSWVDWPEGFLLLVGIPLKVLGVSDFRSLELGVTVVMITLGMISAVSAILLAQKVIRSFWLCLVVFILASVNFLLVRFSCLGQVDHHIVEAILPPLVLWMMYSAYGEKPVKGAQYLLAFILAFSLLLSSSSLFIFGVFHFLYAVVFGNRSNLRAFLTANFVTLIVLLPYVIWSVHLRGDPASITQPSFFHIVLIIFCTGFSAGSVAFRSKIVWFAAAFLALVSFCYIFRWPDVLVRPLLGALHYVFARGGILANVSEAAPIFRNYNEMNFDFMHLNFGYLIWALPLAWVVLLGWKKLTMHERAFFVWLSLMSIPGIFQKRFSQLIVIGFIVFLVWGTEKIASFFERRRDAVSALLASIVMLATTAPMMSYGFAPQGSPRDRVDLGASAYFLKSLDIKEEDAWNRLAGKAPVESGIWANPNMGHMLQYFTGYGVVVNSFYHDSSMREDLNIRLAKSEEELRKKFSELKLRYAILADDFMYFDMLLNIFSVSDVEIVTHQMQGGRMVPTIRMDVAQNYAWSRLMMQDWNAAGFKRLFSNRFSEPHFYTFVKGLEFTGYE